MRSQLGRLSRHVMRISVGHPPLRKLLNRVYLSLGPTRREQFWRHYAKIFREHPAPVVEGTWKVKFGDRYLLAPLSSKQLWRDWDTAVSITGHDLDVKNVYLQELKGQNPPELFIDIGANYGTHSLLMTAAGCDCLSFEPNPDCISGIARLFAANGFSIEPETVALSETVGEAKLSYRSRDTWCGTIVGAGAAAASNGDAERVVTVPIRRLDDYYDRISGRRTLIKIDVEGSEVGVLRGGTRVLSDVRPTLLLECRREDATRPAVFELLCFHRYAIFALSESAGIKLSPGAFASAPGTDFLARPMA